MPFVIYDLLARTINYGSLLLAATLTSPVLNARAKSDVLVMKNGDHITCEIVNLTRGQLQIKTDYALGTITLDWDSVAHVQSDQAFVVEDVRGVRQSGSIKTLPEPTTELVI